MNRYHFKQSRCLLITRRLMAIGVLLIASKAAIAGVNFLSIDTKAQLFPDGTVALTGSYYCREGDNVVSNAIVTQRFDSIERIDAIGLSSPTSIPSKCPGPPSRVLFAVVIQPVQSQFELGRAKASFELRTADQTNPEIRDSDTVVVDVMLVE